MKYLVVDRKNFPKQIGVYSIIFEGSTSNKKYIGSTSKSFQSRWGTHIRLLRKGIHHSKPLQNAYIKYGEDKIIFEVLEICSSELCLKKEDSYLLKEAGLYNIKPMASSCLGHKVPREIVEKSNSTKRLRRQPFEADVLQIYSETCNLTLAAKTVGITWDMACTILKDHGIAPQNGKYKIKKVFAYDLQGKFIGEWGSAKECAQALNLKSHCTISHIATGRNFQYKSYWFSYEKLNQEEAVKKIEARRNKKHLDVSGSTC